MKFIFVSLLLMFASNAFSQSSATFYFDKDMHPVSKKEAVIYGNGQMENGLYKLTCYYLKRKKPIACVAHFTDSTQSIHEGPYQFYFENGATGTTGNYHNGEKQGLWIDYNDKKDITDSLEYKDGQAISRTGFYDVNHQKLVTVDDVPNNKLYITIYDSKGNIVSREESAEDYTDLYLNSDTSSSFPAGPAAWQRYITQALLSHVSDFSDNDYGTVLIRFVVDADGNITNVKPLNKKTSMLAMIGFNAIDGGPKWKPAEHNGQKVRTVIIQPLTIANPR